MRALNYVVALGALCGDVTVARQNPPPQAAFPGTTYPNAVDPRAAAGARSNQTSPPFYPSPWGSGAGDWADAYSKARAFVAQLTLLEKVNLTTGVGWSQEKCVGNTGAIPRLGFRSLCLQDAPLGIRFTDYNSVFPAGVTIAATFDRGLMYQRGYAMGSEFRDKGIDVQLGPVAGPLGRSPEAGRNWEGFSPDPVLTGIGMAETIRGIQEAGVVACAKHFILNEQEHFRQFGEATGYGYNITEALSSNVDDVTMHELYLWPFADAVRAGVGSVMCSYQQINNSYGCQNSYTLNHLLKNELGFQGFVMSDWQAQHSGVSSALAGLDMSMPGDVTFGTGTSFWGGNLTIAVINGSVPEWRIDDMATRIVAAWYKVGRDRTTRPINFSSWTLATFGYEHWLVSEGYGLLNEHVDVRDEHNLLIRNIAARGTVLLKNNNNTLPLKKPRFIGVFGQDAAEIPYGENGCPDRGCDNGTLAQGWGSGTSNYPYLVTPMTALQNQALADGSIIQFVTNNYAYPQIEAVARQASICIAMVTADSGEGYISVDQNEGDRNNLTLWHDGERLIRNVTASCNNTVVVIHSVGPVLVESFVNNPNVTAIVWAGLPGQESGNSLTDILYGRVNPAGRTPFTWGARRQDYGTDVLYEPNALVPQADFTEGVFIDYRAFDKQNINPIYEFGFGLSYTTFEYSNLQVRKLNVGPYVPAGGLTSAAPSTQAISHNPSDYLFPANFSQVSLYIYPYLNNTNPNGSNLSTASSSSAENDPSIPPNALSSSPQPIPPAGGAPGGNPQLYDVLYQVSATIRNTGPIGGEEVPQLYISLGGPSDPRVVLRGFERLSIDAGSYTTFHADISRRDVSNWDPVSQNWFISNYTKTIYVGSSSRKLPLSAVLE
ncbi:MAG: hypothetical protein M1816_003155 [Peltula sp. TS41687]|nr:MAG: hypothetical protein M1816_003155 [Peltula sp. TS41687]